MALIIVMGATARTSDLVIQINHQPDATIFPVYYPDVYLQLNMFQVFSHPSSGTQ
jgi:hypothetical protein